MLLKINVLQHESGLNQIYWSFKTALFRINELRNSHNFHKKAFFLFFGSETKLIFDVCPHDGCWGRRISRLNDTASKHTPRRACLIKNDVWNEAWLSKAEYPIVSKIYKTEFNNNQLCFSKKIILQWKSFTGIFSFLEPFEMTFLAKFPLFTDWFVSHPLPNDVFCLKP